MTTTNQTTTTYKRSVLPDYHVEILPEVYDKIMFFVKRSPIEISGMGKVQFIDGVPTVTSAYLVDQVNSSAETEMCDKALAKLPFETREDPGHLNFWWHSHVNMGVFWSSTDYEAIEQLGGGGWVLATVFNKKEEMRTAIYQGGSDFFPPVFIDDLDLSIVNGLDEDVKAAYEKEYAEKCRAKTYPVTYNTWGTGGAYTGKPVSLLPATSGRSTTTGTSGSLDEKVALPTVYNRNTDGPLDILQLSRPAKLEWAKLFYQFYADEPMTWAELDEFREEWKDSVVLQ